MSVLLSVFNSTTEERNLRRTLFPLKPLDLFVKHRQCRFSVEPRVDFSSTHSTQYSQTHWPVSETDQPAAVTDFLI